MVKYTMIGNVYHQFTTLGSIDIDVQQLLGNKLSGQDLDPQTLFSHLRQQERDTTKN